MPNTSELVEYIQQYIFGNLFNYACNTLRNNVSLIIMNQGKPVRGSIYNNVIQTELPDSSNFYYMYLCNEALISNLLRDVTDWGRLDELTNDDDIRLDLFSGKHLMISKAVVHVKMISDHQLVVIIPKKVIDKTQVDRHTMYMIISEDMDPTDDRVTLSHAPVVNECYGDILMEINSGNNDGKMLAYVNGWNYEPSKVSQIADIGEDFVELIIDDNVKFDFVVDLGDRATYLSEGESLYKDIVILPENEVGDKVYTYDTMDVIVRDKDSGRGLLLPFIDDKSVSQLTHNVVAVSSFLIDAALDDIGGTSHELYIQVSNRGKDQADTGNGSLTQSLYYHGDEKVMDAIKDELYPKVPVWTGSRLEGSQYAASLTFMNRFGITEEEQTSNHVKALGYFDFMKVIGSHIGKIDVGSVAELSIIEIPKPYFWEDSSVTPLVYMNGLKLNDSLYTVIDETENTLTVEFGVPHQITIGSVISYSLMNTEVNGSYTKEPTASDSALVVPNDGSVYHIYRRVDTNHTDVISEFGLYSYEEINAELNIYFTKIVTDENITYHFGVDGYDEYFLVVEDDVSFTNLYYNRSITSNESLAFTIETETGYGEVVPVLTEGTYDVYLNGRYLVKGIDYHIVKVEDAQWLRGYTLVIQNKRWLEDENDIELYRTNRKSKTAEAGYVIDRRVSITQGNEIWVEGVSKLYVDGKLVDPEDVTRHDDHYELASGVSTNGNEYQFVTEIPMDMYRYYQSNEDPQHMIDRSSVVFHYAHGYDYENIQPIIIPSVNKMYSVFLNEAIKKILNDEIVVDYVADDDAIMAQLGSLMYLRSYDLLYVGSLINLNYMDPYPISNTNVEIEDMDKYLFIKRLVSIVIGMDHVNDGHVQFYRS